MAVWKPALLVVLLCVSRVAAAQPVDLTKPLPADEHTIALFHLDDVASGQVRDAAGGPAGAAEDATPTVGRFGGAVSFNGVGGWIDVPDRPETAPQDGITVECWVKFRKRAGGDIICRNGGYMIRVGSTIRAMFGIDGTWRSISGATAVPVGRWTHLAITYSPRTKQISIYIDGKLDVAGVPRDVTEGKLEPGASVLRIGSNDWSPTGSVPDGKLDELRISSIARTYEPLHPIVPKAIPRNANLVGNPSFESGLYGWRITREGNTRLLWHVETGDAAHGRAFLRAGGPDSGSIISYPFTIAPGKRHTMAVTMRADKPCNGRLRLQNTGGGRGSETHYFNVTQDWQRFSKSFDVPEDWATDKAYVEISGSDDARVDVDAVSVAVGEESDYARTETDGLSVGLLAELPPHRTYMLNQGGALPVKVTNTARQDRNLALTCAVTDWLGRQVSRQEVKVGTVPAGGVANVQLELPNDAAGWFVAHLSVHQDGRLIKETERIFNVIEPMQGVGDVMDSPLGMNTHMEREPTEHLNHNMEVLAQCGVKWIRAWWGWGMAEKEPGQFDWTEYDRQLQAVNRAGMEIMPILLRYYPAYEQEWAGEVDRIQRPPYDLDQWSNFVETTARHYRGRVQAWEVWNEANYTMEPDYYAKLLKATYDSIRKVDPDVAVVGFGGTSPDYMEGVFKAGSVKCMDIMAMHSYAQIGRPFEQMQNLADAVQRLVKEYGPPNRVWHTEQGSRCDGVGYRASSQTEEQCAVNLAQCYLSALSTGVEKFFWFSAQTTPTYGFAVFYENYVPRPRLVALNGLARVLKGRRVTGRTTLGDGRVACVLMDGPAGAAAALWNLDETMTVRLPEGARAVWVDMLANPVKPEGPAGTHELRLGRPLYILTERPGQERLDDMLQRAEVNVRMPVALQARPGPDGTLQLAVQNEDVRNLDLRVSVQAPGLLAQPPEATVMADLGPGETRTLAFALDTTPARGRQVPVTVGVEIGEHGTRTITSRKTVRF